MLDDNGLIVEALKNNIRFNTSNNTVEIYDDYGVKLVLRNLDSVELETFKSIFRNY